MADDPEDAAKRTIRQTKLFNAIIHGHRELKSAADGNRFLEALCVQQDVTKCVECLIAAPEGLSAVAKSFRFSRNSAFLNGPATLALNFLSDPALKQLYGGEFLFRVLETIVEPPTFWNNLCEAHDAGTLSEDATKAFAWLLVEILCASAGNFPDVRVVAQRVTENETLINSSCLEIRNLGQKVKHVLGRSSADATHEGPGGRHDNDFADFRKVKILPTPDEFLSKDRPFYRQADAVREVDPDGRGEAHLDNQFRLLREDLLAELRNDFQIATGQKKGRRKSVLKGLRFAGLHFGRANRRKPCSFKLRCTESIPQLVNLPNEAARRKFLADTKSFLKHQSLGCLVAGGEIIAFGNVEREDDLLAEEPPAVVVRVEDDIAFRKVLIISNSTDLEFFQVDTAVFAYEPVLKCLQTMSALPLQDQLLDLHPGATEALSEIAPTNIIDEIRDQKDEDLQNLLETCKKVELDVAQADSLLAGLTRKVSLIQGPPGTGKSFIGALLAKILHDHTNERILVQTYTNHALDQFLEDLLDIGIPPADIVRLGSKFTPATKQLSISEQRNSRLSGLTYHQIDEQKAQSESYHDALQKKVDRFLKSRFTATVLLDYLEFSEHSEFYDAFSVPEPEDGMAIIGKDGKQVSKDYLLTQWISGKDGGAFKDLAQQQFPTVWNTPHDQRSSLLNSWRREIIEEHVSEISNLARKYDACQRRLRQLWQEKDAAVIQQKRIIGCTTTAAAMFTDLLQRASPGIVLVEEAGEILETHTLTAMTSDTKQLILIGDHKQLRPKVNNYELTIEKGDGYNLNMSLFERLVHAGMPHTMLSSQHRMRPEISSLVRRLTYPELKDAPATNNRPNLRGCQSSIIYIAHGHPELSADRIADKRDEGAKQSKENKHEVGMVLKIVRYLGQQGYGTDKMVILTPYLGQLFLLQSSLSKENDPILNDLDSFELVRAGLMTPAAGNVGKRKIRISTIDNYQGEESDIVIASLTRSNPVGDIGFMASPQRLNVLLSRARNALIMIGNADTFMNSRKGKEVWNPFMDQLKREGYIYHGFPIRCEQHPDKKAILSSKAEFNIVCPDGGCSEPCGVTLNCGQHTCPHRCHQLQDHSKMECKAIVTSKCSQNHLIRRKCFDIAAALCRKCEAEALEKERRRQRDYKLDQERQVKQAEYARRLAEVKGEIDYEKRLLKECAEDQDRKNALAQHQQDLKNLRQTVRRATTSADTYGSSASAAAPTMKATENQNLPRHSHDLVGSVSAGLQSLKIDDSSSDQSDALSGWDLGEAKDDWERQKDFEGAQNEALDELMGMIGLESVKEQFLAIKSKVDTLVRQNVSLKQERFGAALLGNPGTGKTTVARLYAKFLFEVGAIPGSELYETSGSSLANEGVSGCKDHIQELLDAGGGVMFIDETYQLVSGNSYGGAAVLDYLLAEIENLTGKIVFVMAGYHKQMEAFFAHNPGIPSRIPKQMEFEDYTDQELRKILSLYINKRYKGLMKVEDGFKGLYMRIVARRIGRGRGRDGFGNAREVQNRISQITERQAKRLRNERRLGRTPDDNLLTKEDLIGPEPKAVLKNNEAWSRLQKMIGLQSVKDSVRILLDDVQYNYQRELEEKPPVQYSLNRCFIGSPGTGKTSVAKLYGRILRDIGLLSNGEVIVKNPSDFVGSALGQSEANTKAILASTVGKVLIIDEAYMLAGSSTADPYKTAVIDTIVAEVQSVPGEDRCVLLLGYKEQMEEMFRDVNPGLARRFPLSSSFEFEDFSDAELRQILELKLRDIGFNATDQAKQVAMEVLKRARNRPNFGNAGEVDIILDKAKALHQKHKSQGKTKLPDSFEAFDFDPEFDRAERAATNLPRLFQDVVGCEDLIQQLQGYQVTAANAKALGLDPREQIPFSFLFKGPPGTGKTTTAQKMGKVFYDMGFLAQAKVVECSASDLVGQYVGQTGPKVRKLLETALGKVLFVDEAYRLAEGGFAAEALDELVDSMTKPKYAQKLVIILAGYDEDIDRLMSINPGLTSRFPESVVFKHMSPETCLLLMMKVLQGFANKQNGTLDLSILGSPSPDLRKRLLEQFEQLSESRSWGNGRDVKSLAKNMFRKLISTPVEAGANLVLTESIVIGVMDAMLDDRNRRSKAADTTRHGRSLPTPRRLEPQQQHSPTPAATRIHTKVSEAPPEAKKEPPQKQEKKANRQRSSTSPSDERDPQRDPSVSDAVWHQLLLDKQAAVARENEYKRQLAEKVQEEQRIAELKKREQAAADEAERRRLEEERIRAEIERRKRDEELAALERERQKEMEMKKKLTELGVCCMGYAWIKQASGYRCAGGSHYLSDAQVSQMMV